MALDANRERALDLAVSQIEKQFGKGAIMKLGDDAAAPDVPVVSTGSLGLDLALGVGGLPRGRVVEIYGPESSGKTTLALQVVACAQRDGGVVAELHDRPFAELLLDLAHGEVECAFAVRVECHATSSYTGTGAARLHRCPTVTPAG